MQIPLTNRVATMPRKKKKRLKLVIENSKERQAVTLVIRDGGRSSEHYVIDIRKRLLGMMIGE